ncbi:MAG TPA: hypothetical protein VKM54_18825 [Myxococcota bacterium]|nr:hypothetical protein [Myxococcota bacterium]
MWKNTPLGVIKPEAGKDVLAARPARADLPNQGSFPQLAAPYWELPLHGGRPYFVLLLERCFAFSGLIPLRRRWRRPQMWIE